MKYFTVSVWITLKAKDERDARYELADRLRQDSIAFPTWAIQEAHESFPEVPVIYDREQELTTLRAENARLLAVVAAAGELLRDSLCVVHDRGKYTVEQQKQLWDKYQAAVDAARSETA